MQVSKSYYDEIFDYKGQWNVASRCGLRILNQKGKKVIVVTELYQDNPGASVTYTGKSLALQICEAKHIDFNNIVYIECNPGMDSKLSFYDEEYFEVTFSNTQPFYRLLSKDELSEIFNDNQQNQL